MTISNFDTPEISSRKSSPWPARVAWVAILCLTAFIVYRNARPHPTPSDEVSLDDIRIRMVGEQLVGIKVLGSKVGQTQADQILQSQSRMIQQLDEAARSAGDKLHVAIIAGELLGAEQALTRLNALSGNPELAEDISALRGIYSGHYSGKGSALDPAIQDRLNRLSRRHDYFGRLALSYGVPADAEPRKSVEAGALHATMMMGLVGVVFAVLLLGAAGFFIAGIVLQRKGRIHKAYVADPFAGTAYLEGFAIYFVLFILGFGLLRRFLNLQSLQWEWLALFIIPVVLFWCSMRGATAPERRLAFGWHTGKGVLREIGAGIAGYFAGIILMIVGITLTYVLMKRSGIQPEHPLIHMLAGDRWHVLGLYALVSVFAPVMEETMFRGALFHHLRRRWGWAVSAPIVAFIFAIIHPQGWVAVPALGSIALMLAALREWRGSLIAPMVAHACNNFVVLTLALVLLR